MGDSLSVRDALRVLRDLGLRRYLRAQAALLAAELELRLRPRGELASVRMDAAPRTGEATPPRPPGVPDRVTEQKLALGREWARVLADAARIGPVRGSCLARAVALARRLSDGESRGAGVRVGVRMEDSGLVAHAWVDVDGHRLDGMPGGEANCEGYTELPGVRIRDLS